ncbi:MAG TPA: histidine phosphatase family protein [Candidatus Paceibacterota bacterium]|nr:histidine phosphatase family protein [Candidatus Paceibacterota bacterium]
MANQKSKEVAVLDKAAGIEFGCARCGEFSDRSPRRIFHFARQGKADEFSEDTILDYPYHDLSLTGILQAREAAENFANSSWGKKVRMLMASPIGGARGTAEYFSKKLKVPVICDWKLVERDMNVKFYYENRRKPCLGSIMRHDCRPDGISPSLDFESETIDSLNTWATDQRFGTNTLFVTNALRIATIMKIAKGWGEDMMATRKPPRNCEIITLGIGSACEECGGFIYEPAP